MRRSKGFTKIPHEILEKLFSSQFTAKQLRAILLVLRYSTGFHKETALIPKSVYFEICGISSKDVKRDGGLLTVLEEKAVLKKYSRGENGVEYAVNPDTDEWDVSPAIEARYNQNGKESVEQRLKRLGDYKSELASLAVRNRKSKKPP